MNLSVFCTLIIFVVFVTLRRAEADDHNLYILSHPKSVLFRETVKPIKTTEISIIPLALFGIPSQNELQWDGLLEGSLFCRPKAVVFVSITGSIGPFNQYSSYKIQQDRTGIDSEWIANYVNAIPWSQKSLTLHQATDSVIIDVTSSYPELMMTRTLEDSFNEINLDADWTKKYDFNFFDKMNQTDWVLPAEMYRTYVLINKLKSDLNVTKANAPNFMHIEWIGLQKILASYGPNSRQLLNAQRIIKHALVQMIEDMNEIYAGNVVIVVEEMEEGEKRMKRQTNGDTNSNLDYDSIAAQANYAKEQSENYPVIFNIVLWLCIAMGLALLWICWGIWHMDPGRDSVIYRMTSQRTKKD